MRKENIEDDDREEIGKGHMFQDDINKPEKTKDQIYKSKKKCKLCKDLKTGCNESCNQG